MVQSENDSDSSKSKQVFMIIAGLLVLFLLAQLLRFVVPSLKLDNPPETQTVSWDSAHTQELWDRACADCHSNQTVWPWYSYVAPIGWLVANDVHGGRGSFNISEDRRIESREMTEIIREGEMPPAVYLIMHRNADLNDAEKTDLIAGLQATFGSGGVSDNFEGEGDDD